MMTKFLSLLARAQVVTLDNGSVVDVELAEVTGEPENQVVRLSCPRLNGRGSCSTMLTKEGLAAVTFDAESKFFKLDDYEGDPVVLKLTDGDEVLTPETEDVVYLVIQEGGSSGELYIHTYDARKDAEAGRVSCEESGAYRTSKNIIEVAAGLANHPEFYQVAEMLLGATATLGFPSEAE